MSTEHETNNSAPLSPEQYIHDEVAKARIALKRTQIFGSIILLALAGETALVAGKFAYALQPKEAATIATGMVADQLDQHSDEIKASISERIPALIEQSPDYVINALPGYRTAIEDKVDETLVHYTQSTSSALGSHIDDYIDNNKAAIKSVLDAGSSPTSAASLGPGLRQQLSAYLTEKPADGGPSISDQIDESLTSLQEVQSQVHHLATDSNLTPTELQTRHALAVIASSVRKENLEPIPLKEAMPQPGQDEASAQ